MGICWRQSPPLPRRAQHALRCGRRSYFRTYGGLLEPGLAIFMAAPESERSRLDDAARAGWLYFIAGHTQDEIAKMLQVSRASAQRLVSRLKDRFNLVHSEVVPTDPASPHSTAGIAERCANLLDSTLRPEIPVIVALGTGRAVRAAVERVTPIERPNHQIVSLVGNISADGSASFYDTVGRLADRTGARHYPM